MSHAGRIVGVTAGLAGAGALFGGLAGGSAFCVSIILSATYLDLEFLAESFLFAGAFGAVIGSIAAPLLAWLLLRHVPFGRVFLGLVIGTIVGGIIGWFAAPRLSLLMYDSLGAAFLGCLTAAIVLRYRVQRA